MQNLVSRGIEAIWTAIKDTARWIGRTVKSIFGWVWDQFANLFSCFYQQADEVINLACEAKGIPKD